MYRSFLGKAGETHAASHIALRGYVMSLPLTDIGEDLFAVDAETSKTLRVQVKASRCLIAQDKDEDITPDAVEPADEAADEVDASPSYELAPATDTFPTDPPAATPQAAQEEVKKKGRPKNTKEQATFAVTIKRSQLEVDRSDLIFIFVLVNDRRFRSFIVPQTELRAILTAGGREIFKKPHSKSKTVTLTVDADNIPSGEVRVGGTGARSTSVATYENAWDKHFPPTSICIAGGG